jgi:AcrR family transcriptional regulator
MSPKVPAAYLKARRTEIMDAAYQCFVKKGFHNTTMQDIYDTTSLSPGAVYNYFSSKEDIVVAAVQEFNDWTMSVLESLISQNLNESLINIAKFWLLGIRQTTSNKDMSAQLEFYAEATRNSKIRDVILQGQETTHKKLIEIIKHGQLTGTFNTKLDPQSTARVIVGMVFMSSIHKMLDNGIDLDAYGQVCEVMIKGAFTTSPKHRPVKK